jgi:hypothetical protein
MIGKNYWRAIEPVAPRLGIAILRLPIKNVGDLEGAFALALRERSEALVVFPDATTFGARARIAEFAIRNRLASAFDSAQFADVGGFSRTVSNCGNLAQQVIPRFVDKNTQRCKSW